MGLEDSQPQVDALDVERRHGTQFLHSFLVLLFFRGVGRLEEGRHAVISHGVGFS